MFWIPLFACLDDRIQIPPNPNLCNNSITTQAFDVSVIGVTLV